MSTVDEEQQEFDVPVLALQALKAANELAREAGHPRIVVRDRQLVRICGETITVLKQLPPRPKVRIRPKPALS